MVTGVPDILVVVLLRFKLEKGLVQKNQQRVTKPLENIEVNGTIFVLNAVVVHTGSHMSGHYTALTKYKEMWFRCDDSIVRKVGVAEALMEASSGYIFVYMKC